MSLLESEKALVESIFYQILSDSLLGHCNNYLVVPKDRLLVEII